MKAVRVVEVGKALEEADVSLPEIGPSEVLIRVAAAGICHSDAHYRGSISKIERLPVTLGHEVVGRVEKVGLDVTNVAPGDRVCVHYLVHCGSCEFCLRGLEQFCREGQMIGKHRDGGYAEFIKVPARNAFVLPDEISFESGAIMMCSSATALHALNKARLKSGESVSIFPYTELINKEVEIIGVSDHLATEFPALMEFARSGKLCFPPESLRFVDLDAGQINGALDALEGSIDHVRTVIIPQR